ncbi:hypothetical protein CQW49_21830 (plasmid) [Methylosinus trichosporium OB3b]|uniref:FecR N-terminal domain-containing protein n=1 Tax=Methylosinus trichosporium (strain ATCC 35070 / NCIMB 11131 / UNIQEM 75 / OB3b) TaxID=595536 RepID=A0A2D2D6I6_METT3|nr:FecR/PupR family sigma factor regulator [Methylosinus trichosporium]ATQ70631.1 hypothetical protein CQW49_21830 [Methylosinus trichosporium OB3b]
MGDSADRSDGDGFEDDLDPISREAVDWFMIRHADGAAGADDATFRRWLESDPRRRAAYADVERLWSGAADLPSSRAPVARRAQS